MIVFETKVILALTGLLLLIIAAIFPSEYPDRSGPSAAPPGTFYNKDGEDVSHKHLVPNFARGTLDSQEIWLDYIQPGDTVHLPRCTITHGGKTP